MQYIDLRSDTVTEPTKQMRQSILTAQYGDWPYGEDPTIHALEKQVAQLLGKEDSTFVPSGVFGNQCMLLSVGKPGQQLILGDRSHIAVYQNGSVGLLSRMMCRTLPSDPQTGFLLPQILFKYIRKLNDAQSPQSSVLVLENPTSEGRIYPKKMLQQLIEIGKQAKLHVHLDGARIFHVVLKQQELHSLEKKSVQEIAKENTKSFDSIMFCLSKGLGAPIGSMLAGTKDFIAKTRINRKRLGGCMRKPGIIAQSAIMALQSLEIQNHISQANWAAQKLSEQLVKMKWIQLVTKVQINMIFFRFCKEINTEHFRKFLFQKFGIKCFLNSKWDKTSRFVTHHYVDQKAVSSILEAFAAYEQVSVEGKLQEKNKAENSKQIEQ